MKKSFVIAFCTLFIFLSALMSFSEDSDGITVSEHVYETTPTEAVSDGTENKTEDSKVEVVEEVRKPVEQTTQPRVQPRTQAHRRVQTQRRDNRPPAQNREVRQEESDPKMGTLLPILESDFRYSRIPNIKINDESSSNRNITVLEFEFNENETEPNMEIVSDDVKGIIIEPDVLAKIGLLLFVFGVIAVYKLTSSKGSRKRKIKF